MIADAVQDEWTCMGVQSDGSYGVDRSLFYSFPVVIDAPTGDGRGTYRIVGGLDLDTDTTTHVAQTTKQLRAELDEALVIDDQMPAVTFDDIASVAEPPTSPVTAASD